MLPYFQNLVLSERQLLDKTNELRGLESGTVRVLVFDSISIHWIPGILREFKRDYPGVKIELVTVENSTQAEEMVFRHEVDCGFFLHSPISLDLDTIDLMTEKLQAIVSPEHPLAKKKKFPVKELGNHPFIRMAFSDNTGVS